MGVARTRMRLRNGHALAGLALAWIACLIACPIAGAQADAQAGGGTADRGEDIAAMLAPGTDLARFPNEDAVILFYGDTIILHADGRIDRNLHRVVRLNTDLAIEEFGDPRVPYDTLYQELVVHACRTYTPDGQVVPSDQHAYNRVTPDAAAACAGALNRQEMVLTHLGIERGCVVELDIEVRDRVPHAPWLEGMSFLPMNYPVMRRVVTIKYPAGIELNTEIVNGAIEPTEVDGRDDDGGAARIRIFRAENIPAARENDDGTGGRLTRAHLLYSTCPGRDVLGARLRADFEQAASIDTNDPAVAEWIATLRNDPTVLTPSDQVRAIVELTANLVHDVGSAPFENYHAPAPAGLTLATSCGDLWDKAALATALCAAVGIETQPILRAARPETGSRVIALEQFDRVLLYAEIDDGGIPMAADAATGETGRLDTLLHDRAQLLIGGEIVREASGERRVAVFQLLPPRDRAERVAEARVKVTITLAGDGKVSGEADLALTGELCPLAPPADLAAFATAYAGKLVPGAEVTGTTATRIDAAGAELRIRFTAPALGTERNGYRYLTLAGGPTDFASLWAGLDLKRPERSTAICLPGQSNEQAHWRIRLPESVAVGYLPANETLSTEAGDYHISARVDMIPVSQRADDAARVIDVEWGIGLDRVDIPPDLYNDFRRLAQAYTGESARLLILR
jgi:hypothetical protein